MVRKPVPIVSTMFLFGLALMANLLTIPIAASNAGLDPAGIGMVIALPGLAGLAALYATLTFNRHQGEARSLSASFLLLAGAGAFVGLRDASLLPLGAVLLGISSAFFWPAALTVLSSEGGERRQAEGGMAQGLAGLGAGILVAANLNPPQMAAALAGVGLAGLVFSRRATSKRRVGSPTVWEAARAIRERSAAVLGRRDSLASSLATFPFTVLGWIGGTSFMVLYVVAVGLSPAFAGLVVAIRSVTAIAFRAAYPAAVARVGVARVWLIGNLVAAAATVAVPLGSTPLWLIGCSLIQGVGLSAVLPAANSMAAKATSDTDRPIGYALPFATAQLTLLIMPVLLGVVASAMGIGVSLGAAGLLGGLSAGGLFLMAGGGRPATVAWRHVK